jgi:hypothetical protein
MLLHGFEDLHFEFELFVEFITHLEYLQGVVAIILVIEYFKNLSLSNFTLPKAPEPSIFTISNR